MNLFKLDDRLKLDCDFVADLEFSQLLLMNNANFPWLILVPRKNDISEITDLELQEQILLLKEINLVSQIMKSIFIPEKINIAALGNIVKQLHIHIIARYKNDIAWPKPVFGEDKLLYTQNRKLEIITLIKNNLLNT